MNASAIAVLLAAAALAAACDSQPSVTYVANGSDFSVLGLTNEGGECALPAKVGYLTWWDGATVRGCWVRDRAEIRVRFNDMDDLRIPIGEFRRTEVGDYRYAALD